MQEKELITYNANSLIQVRSKKWLCAKIGITQHTINRRLYEHDWKASEAFVIDTLYDKIILKRKEA
jgi:hypothetical protein